MCSEALESSKCAGCDRKDEDQKTRMLKKLSIGKVSLCRCVSMYVLRRLHSQKCEVVSRLVATLQSSSRYRMRSHRLFRLDNNESAASC